MEAMNLNKLSLVFGGKVAAATLLYLEMYGSCYSSQVATNFKFSPSMVQKQLEKFEEIGIVGFEQAGRTKIYSFNPKSELAFSMKELLRKFLAGLDESDFTTYFNERRRPRRQGKPLWIQEPTK